MQQAGQDKEQVQHSGRQGRAVFFDRDGVLNHDLGYLYKAEDFQWTDGAKEAIKLLNDSGWLVFVVTNQSGIARGYYTATDLQALHAWMQQDLAKNGAHIDDWQYCPHHPEAEKTELRTACACRKPEPGMILALLKKWRLDADKCLLIGDKKSDLEAAERAGMPGYLFQSGNLLEFIRQNIPV